MRQTLIDFGAATVLRDVGFEQFDTVVGGETAGIPFAAWMADKLMLPMQYVRKKPKGFGRNAQIEGHLEPGQRVLLVEDLTTDGGSKVNFCNALRAAGATVEHIFVIFFYGIYPNSEKFLRELNIKLHHLCTWWDVLEFAKTCSQFDPIKLAEIEKFLHEARRLVEGARRRCRQLAAEYAQSVQVSVWSSTIPSRCRCRRTEAWPVLMNIQRHRALHAGRGADRGGR